MAKNNNDFKTTYSEVNKRFNGVMTEYNGNEAEYISDSLFLLPSIIPKVYHHHNWNWDK